MKRRLIGLAIGLAYAISLGFFLMLITGGGHGNFGWIVFFLLTTLLGLLYPATGFLIADLRPVISKSAVIAIFLVHIFLVSLFFSDNFIQANSSRRDFSFQDAPLMFLFLVAVLSIPQVASIIFFVLHIIKGGWKQSD